jgi:hypothetical protein
VVKRVNVKNLLADPVSRRALMVSSISALQQREGIDTSLAQAGQAYDRVAAERGRAADPSKNPPKGEPKSARKGQLKGQPKSALKGSRKPRAPRAPRKTASEKRVAAKVRGLRAVRQVPPKSAKRASGVEAIGAARGARLRSPERSDGEILRGLADRTICGARLSRKRLLGLEAAGLLIVEWATDGGRRYIGRLVITESGAAKMEGET